MIRLELRLQTYSWDINNSEVYIIRHNTYMRICIRLVKGVVVLCVVGHILPYERTFFTGIMLLFLVVYLKGGRVKYRNTGWDQGRVQ